MVILQTNGTIAKAKGCDVKYYFFLGNGNCENLYRD
jgi:hypothetical protein